MSAEHGRRGFLQNCATVAVLIMIGLPTTLSAQFESYLEKVTDIHFSLSCWESAASIRSPACPSTSGYSVEVIWNLGTAPWGPRYSRPAARKLVRVEVSRASDGSTAVDSIFEITAAPDSTKHYAVIELGLGYSQISGLRSPDESYQLQGTVRELPALSVYTSFPTVVPYVTPYVGARTGLIKLHNAQLVGPPATDTTETVYLGSSEAFQLGAILGVAVGPRRIQGTIEAAYHWRRFPSVLWASSNAALPRDLPREINLSGPTVAVGVQVKLRDPPK